MKSLEGKIFMEEMPDMNMFWTAIADKNWPIVIGVALMLIVWGVRRYLFDEIPKRYLPLIILLLPTVSGLGTRMVQYVNDGKLWWQGLIQGMFEGVMIGFTAMGAWDIKKSSEKKAAIRHHKQFFRKS